MTTTFAVPGGPDDLMFEYVKSTRVIRLVAGRPRITLDEVPVTEFLDRLGIELDAPRRYVLFGGSQDDVTGGLGDLVGVFEGLDEARAAFTALRLAPRSFDNWAELASLSPKGRTQLVCWFGRDRPVRRGPEPTAASTAGGGRRRRRGLLRRAQGGGPGAKAPALVRRAASSALRGPSLR